MTPRTGSWGAPRPVPAWRVGPDQASRAAFTAVDRRIVRKQPPSYSPGICSMALEFDLNHAAPATTARGKRLDKILEKIGN